ncbi:MAG: biotin--[acetyl-CoA-carboxylase] ligase [Nitrospirae bacterium]|nr:biotin--[acetyl-CoA-carboxylase] ligase [Nitrospirota bacterium]
MFTKEETACVFKGDIIGREIIYLESSASTNDSAFEIGRERTGPDGIVVVAEMQTKGRGRLGRNWVSPAGVNLYFTVLLSPPFPPEEASLMTLAAPVAIASAVIKYTGLAAQIKWPNDIMINGKKTGGVLIEMKSGKAASHLLAVGIGINVNMSPDVLPSEIRPLATSLKMEKGESISRSELLGAILADLEHTYKNLLNGNKRALINEWLRLNCTIGKRVSVRDHARTITGTADSINERGELIVKLFTGETETVRAGDVTILKN